MDVERTTNPRVDYQYVMIDDDLLFTPTDGWRKCSASSEMVCHPAVTAWRVYFRRGSESLFRAAPGPGACGRYPHALPAGIHRSGSWYVSPEQWAVAGRLYSAITERRNLLIGKISSRVNSIPAELGIKRTRTCDNMICCGV